MLYAIAQELGAALRAKGVPFPVVFGPEATSTVAIAPRERIVFEQPIGDKRDAIVPTKATHPNPRIPLNRLQAARIRVFARSSLAGAAWHDHAERAEAVLDHIVAELDAVIRGRKNSIQFNGGGFVAAIDNEGSATWSGAIYELDFTVDRAVYRVTWAGEANEEVVIGDDVAIENVAKVSMGGTAGTPPVDAETASGG
jgi:hypothetical protein